MAASTDMVDYIIKSKHPCEENLVLIRHAWVMDDDVNRPNKYQMLFDELVKPFFKEETDNLKDLTIILETCCDLFHSKQFHDGTTNFITPNFLRKLISGLKCIGIEEVTIRCIKSLYENNQLRPLLTDSSEIMSTVLFGLLHYCRNNESNAEILSLIEALVNDFTYLLNQTVVVHLKTILYKFCDSLFSEILMFNHVIQKDPAFTRLSARISKFIADVMLPSELFNSYQIVKDPPKVMQIVFSKVQDIWNSEDLLVKHAAVEFVPWFYSNFIRVYARQSQPSDIFHMFTYLMNFIGLDVNSGSMPSDGAVIDVISGMLSVVVDNEVYDIGSSDDDVSWKEVLIKLTNLIVSCDMRGSTSWFSCLLKLLKINHQLIMQKQTDIWKYGWIHLVKRDTQSLELQNKFFSKVMETYSSLRQIPHLLKVILEVIASEDEQITVEWPVAFLDSFASTATQLNIHQAFEIWKKFNDQLSSIYISKATNRDVVTKLFFTFLSNIKITDYNVAKVTANQMSQNMKESLDSVLIPWVCQLESSNYQSSDSQMESFLLLAYVWGELAVLLAVYSRDIHLLEPISTKKIYNMNNIVPVSKSGKVWKIVKDGCSTSLAEYLKCLMCAQRMRAALLCGCSSDLSVNQLFEQGVKFLIDAEVASSENESWNGKIFGLNDQNVNVSQWKVLLDFLSIAVIESTDTILPICQHLIDTAVSKSMTNCVKDGELISLYSLSWTFLKSEVCQESAWLHRPLISLLCSSMMNILSTSIVGKNKLAKAVATKFSDLLQDGATAEEDIRAGIPEVSNLLVKNWLHLRDCQVKFSDGETKKLNSILKLLILLPVEFFPAVNKQIIVTALFISMPLVVRSNIQADIYRDTASVFNLLFRIWCKEVQETFFGCKDALDIAEVTLLVYSHYKIQLAQTNDDQLLPMLKEYQNVMDNVIKSIVSSRSFPGDELEKFIHQIKTDIVSVDNILPFWTLGSLLCNVRLGPMYRELKKLVLDNIPAVIQPSVLPPLFKLLIHFIEKGRNRQLNLSQTKKNQSSNEEDMMKSNEMKLDILCMSLVPRFTELAFTALCSGSACVVVEASSRFITKLVSFYEGDILKIRKKLPEDFLLVSWQKLSEAKRHLQPNITVVPSCADFKSDTMLLKSPYDNLKILPLVLGERKRKSDEQDSPRLKRRRKSKHKLEVAVSSDAVKLADETSLSQVKDQIDIAMATVSNNCSAENFSSIVNDVVKGMALDVTKTQAWGRTMSAVDMWNSFSPLHSSTKHKLRRETLRRKSREVLLLYRAILESVSSTLDNNIIDCVVLPILESVTAMLSAGQNLIPRGALQFCLQIIHHVSLDAAIPTQSAAKLLQAIYAILNELIVKHVMVLAEIFPIFIACCKICGVILHGNQATIHSSHVIDMVHCAQCIERLFTLMCTSSHKDEFSPIIVYLVADYIESVVKVTLVPDVKRALLPGIHALLRMCNDFNYEMLHTALSSGTIDVFKGLFKDYQKYHKYKGTV